MRTFRKTDTPLSDEEVLDWLRDLRGNPFVPDSGFDVTAVFRAEVAGEGNYYFAGVNVENPDHRLGTHGEEASIAGMITALGNKAEIKEGWVMGAPRHLEVGSDDPLANSSATCCGKCRQQIVGFADEETPIHSFSLNGEKATTTAGDFLPDHFSFKQFAPELDKANFAQEVAIAPTAEEVENRLIYQGGELTDEQIHHWMDALESADFATKKSEIMIARLDNGAYVAGAKIEDAAFVDISAAQSVVAIANSEFGAMKIQEVWSQTKGRDGVEVPEDAHVVPNLTAVQTLAQFASHKDIPMHIVNGKGEQADIKLSDASRYIPTFDEPIPTVGAERFIGR